MLHHVADDQLIIDCCGEPMRELARAERAHGDKVIVYRCKRCGQIDSVGRASSPHWVGARARSFLELLEEAFQRAGLEAGPAVAVLDPATCQVHFS